MAPAKISEQPATPALTSTNKNPEFMAWHPLKEGNVRPRNSLVCIVVTRAQAEKKKEKGSKEIVESSKAKRTENQNDVSTCGLGHDIHRTFFSFSFFFFPLPDLPIGFQGFDNYPNHYLHHTCM